MTATRAITRIRDADDYVGPFVPLTPTGVKTADYSAAIGDLVLVDGSAAVRTITLPAAPADGSRIGIYNYTFPNAFNIVQASGSDHLRRFGNSSSTLMFVYNTDELVVLQYNASTHLWFIVQHENYVDPTQIHGGGTASVYLDGTSSYSSPLVAPLATPAYSASITPDASLCPWQTITVTNSTAFTINAPSHAPDAAHTRELTIEVLNSSGGAMGAITWDSSFVFPTGGWTNPASTKKRFARFEWNGSAWICTAVAGADY